MASTPPFTPGLEPLAARLGTLLRHPALELRARSLVAARAPDERLALAFMLRLAEDSPESLLTVLEDEALARGLIFCLGSSELVGAGLGEMGGAWPGFFRAVFGQQAHALAGSLSFEPPATAERSELTRALRIFKQRGFLAIAIADLLAHLSVGETMGLMSALADECIRGAYAIARRLMADRTSAIDGFCVLAMGKLGVSELNLSSDIDLLYLFDAKDPQAAQEPAAKLGEAITEILSSNCFRVDLRLRPGGQKAPLAPSLDGAIGFYESFGETWERAALLRARPVGGAIEVGNRFISELAPFIYRRYLDFDTLNQLHAMKARIEHELGGGGMIQRNIKLGRGGIRELEFVVQALTLVYGGRDARLRESKTLPALARLGELGYVEPETARQLSQAYFFLRNVEHKIQVAAGLQSHSLPDDEAALRVLAARLGFGKEPDAGERMLAKLTRTRDLVNDIFSGLLANHGHESAGIPAAAQGAWKAALEPKLSAAELEKMGFARPAESANNLLMLARGPEHAVLSTRRQDLMESLGPSLLAEMIALPDPDLALMNLASFISAVGARTSFLALLKSHPATRGVLLRLFASSGYLSALFIRHPDMLDTLVRSDLAKLRRPIGELKRELSELLTAAADFEARLDVLRAFRHQEFLRIAIADLAGQLELAAVQAELTTLAETVIGEALAIARNEARERIAIPETMALCAVAMGRLGANEMSYNSDLDLIFVYRDTGADENASRETAPRIVQKFISILESRTREGYAYKLDLRLRPSGNAGPLVASLASFAAYHRNSSAIWERQALVRARVIAGNEALGAEVEAARQEFVFGRGLSRDEIAEIAAMRRRMEQEIGAENKDRINLKQGLGGLVDVEFISQMMALRYGRAEHELTGLRSTDALLAALEQAGLIPVAEGAKLRGHYRFLTRLENRLRIESDQAAWAVSTDPAKLTPLARRMGIEEPGSGERLLVELNRRRSEVRRLFEEIFAREETRAK